MWVPEKFEFTKGIEVIFPNLSDFILEAENLNSSNFVNKLDQVSWKLKYFYLFHFSLAIFLLIPVFLIPSHYR